MEYTALTLLSTVAIGLIIGWIYGKISENHGIDPLKGMIIGTIGSVFGGLLFYFLGLGGAGTMAVLSALTMLVITHVFSKAPMFTWPESMEE